MTLEITFQLLTALNGAGIIWLCFERDRLCKKIKELEMK